MAAPAISGPLTLMLRVMPRFNLRQPNGTAMTENPRLPAATEFPARTEFVIYEFDSSLVSIPGKGWFSWWGA